MLLIVTVTLLLYLAFFLDPWLPVAFPLLVPTVWVGLRFAPLPVALHSLAVSGAVVVFTLSGLGPFASLDSWAQEVLVSQLFIGLVFCLGTLLALSRGERLALTQTLATAQRTAQSQAELMSTIIDSMHDGVSVIDERGRVVLRNPAGAAMVQGHRTAPSHTGDYRFVMRTARRPRAVRAGLPVGSRHARRRRRRRGHRDRLRRRDPEPHVLRQCPTPPVDERQRACNRPS